MTKLSTLFHGGLYSERLRQTRLAGIVMLCLATVFDAFPLLSMLLIDENLFDILFYSYTESTFASVHLSLLTLPFIAPFILTLNITHFQSSRRDSDFYHSLPLTKLGLSLSGLAAVVTWCTIITLGSSAIVYLLTLPHDMFTFSFLDMLRDTFASLLSSLLVAAVTFLAASLCGRTLTAVFATVILLFAPRLIVYTLVQITLLGIQVIPFGYESGLLSYSVGTLLYGNYDSVPAWIGTGVLTVLLFALGLWCASRRPSESAEQSAASPALQAVFRLLVGFVCALPAVIVIYLLLLDIDSLDPVYIVTLGFIYLFATVMYFLFELLTVRKAKALLKALPWLGVLAAVHILCIVGMTAATHLAWSAGTNPVLVSSVSVTRLPYSQNINDYSSSTGYGQSASTDNYYLLYPDDIRDQKFYQFSRRYARSDCAKVQLTDRESIAIVCHALSRQSANLRATNSTALFATEEARKNDCDYIYEIDVKVCEGPLTHTRRVTVTEHELQSLLEAVDNIEALPRGSDMIL